MARKRKKKQVRRHRLLIYYHLTQQWRLAPLFTTILALVLYGAGWLYQHDVMNTGNPELLAVLWEGRIPLLVLAGLSFLIYLLLVSMGRSSYVEVRPKALRIRAGLVPLDISYGRIRTIRLVQFGSQYSQEKLKGRDKKLYFKLSEQSCTAIDLITWPRQPIKRLWHKFMFTKDHGSLLFVVEDAMILNQQIDGAVAVRQHRLEQRRSARTDT